MELRQLRTFVTVAQLKGFSSAARALHTVQPAISRQISDLEEELGVRLFWRSTREVKLTTPGEVLLQQATELLAQVEQARNLVKKAGSGEVGRLRVGFISAASQPFLPGLIKAFSKSYPNVHITLTELTAGQQIEALEAGQLDISLSRPLPESGPQNLESVEIYIDQLVVFVPTDHPLAGKSEAPLSAFSLDPFILFERSGAPKLYDQIISTCQNMGFTPEVVHQPNSMQTMLIEVASGLGISLAPGCVRQLNTNGCKSLSLIEGVGPIPFELHYRSDQVEPATQAFVDLVMDTRAGIRKKMEL